MVIRWLKLVLKALEASIKKVTTHPYLIQIFLISYMSLFFSRMFPDIPRIREYNSDENILRQFLWLTFSHLLWNKT